MRSFDELSIEVSTENHSEKPSRETECFWLCDQCASTMTLVREQHTHKVVVVPLHEGIQEGVHAGDTSHGEQSHQG